MANLDEQDYETCVAIIGMAGRFPGADSVDDFWQNIASSVESLTYFTDEQLLAENVSEALFNHPDYVRCGAVINDIDLFDAPFFNINPQLAEVTDPQLRLLLECAHHALEDSGYYSAGFDGIIGVYAGTAMSGYLMNNLMMQQEVMTRMGNMQVIMSNDKDYAATLTSYKLNLTGPSVSLNVACSTSLVTLHLARMALVNYECDMALAGGVRLKTPVNTGYFYQQGGISSPDGHCRAFDAQAAGTTGGSGVGMLVVKRMSDALEDGDFIHAIIRGSAINNDGANKVGFSAPGVDGQVQVIREAQAVAEVDANSISYIEAHGTGTTIGDPIEISALTQAFEQTERQYCALGSVKTNVGHLDTAAGVASVIKVAMALQKEKLPPSLHFNQPNPQIDFANSPFYVNTELKDWQPRQNVRRAGINSFGIGGTNAHVIIEQAPERESGDNGSTHQLLLLSAKSETALDGATQKLAEHLEANTQLDLADVAYTLQVGREGFEYRRMLVCQDVQSGIQALKQASHRTLTQRIHAGSDVGVCLLFSGQGSQYAGMARQLYEQQPVFAATLDECLDLLQPHLDIDLKTLLMTYDVQSHTDQINQTRYGQPALFVVEYALAQMWLSWGVKINGMLGHSIGEYVAACLAGVFNLEQALLLVCARGRLMQEMKTGDMLAVPLSAELTRQYLGTDCCLAAINGPQNCVVSGDSEAIETLRTKLEQNGVNGRLLHTSHAFHSRSMEPMLNQFKQQFDQIDLQPPTMAFVSNVSGQWITDEQATSVDYWAEHLRTTVQFHQGVKTLLEQGYRRMIECGPGQTLTKLLGQMEQPEGNNSWLSVASIGGAKDTQEHGVTLMQSLGQIWLCGAKVNWNDLANGERRLRVRLPGYVFDRERYWIDADTQVASTPSPAQQESNLDKWSYHPSWQQLPARLDDGEPSDYQGQWLIFSDDSQLASDIEAVIQARGETFTRVSVGQSFECVSENHYRIDCCNSDDFNQLFEQLLDNPDPQRVIYLWTLASVQSQDDDLDIDNQQLDKSLDRKLDLNFFALTNVVKALAEFYSSESIRLGVIGAGGYSINGNETLDACMGLSAGLLKVVAQEFATLSCVHIDIESPQTANSNHIVAQLLADDRQQVVALRGHYQWLPTYINANLAQLTKPSKRLRNKGVYLITGGLGGVGLLLAQHLAASVQAKLILVSRTPTDDPQIQQIEQSGGEVLICAADVSNEEQMAEVKRQALARFGTINGVIHAAGIGGGGIILTKSREQAQAVMSAKVCGLNVLNGLFSPSDEIQLDFMLLCSSLNAILGGFGQSDYSAANAYEDAFAHARTLGQGQLTIAVNWDGWAEVGMLTKHADSANEATQMAMSSAQGIEMFERILNGGFPQVVVSCQPLLHRLALAREYAAISAAEQAKQATAPKGPKRQRPLLETEFVAPEDEVQQDIASIWQDVLGISEIGVNDDFFDLGGDSLMITQLHARIRDEFEVEISLQALFDAPTIAAVAELVEEQALSDIDDDLLASMIAEIKSEDE